MPSLSIRGLTMTFGPLKAVDDFTLEAAPASIHAIIGENGAGKSTVARCLYGLYRPESGTFALDGRAVAIRSPRDAMRLGIGMVHQHFMLAPSLSVCENVVLGDEPRRGFRFDRERALAEVRDLMARCDMDVDPFAPVRMLPVGLRQRIEILRLLHRRADVLIFDEPTAVLAPAEVLGLFDIFRTFRDEGKTVIFIAHRLSEVLAVSDRITVMRRGRNMGTMERPDATPEILTRLMVGRDVIRPALPPSGDSGGDAGGRAVLEVRNLPLFDGGGGVSFDIRRGEVFGVAGVSGNGRQELETLLIGLRPAPDGRIFLEGEDISRHSVRKRREAGMAFIPEDRIRTGLATLASVSDNALAGSQWEGRFRAGPFRKNAAIRRFTHALLAANGVVAAHDAVQAGTLSGGNMQRLVMGRELEHDPKFLLAAQPTRGVDVGGSAAIHERILALRAQGGAIALISADLDEILALSDRIAVLSKGRIAAVLSRADASRDRIGALMLS